MENDYGVGISNRYEVFLAEDDDPLDIFKKQEQVKEAKKKQEKENRGATKTVEPVKGKPSVPAAKKQIKETQNLKPTEVPKTKDDNKAIRGPRNAPSVKFAPESREERNNRRNRDERITSSNDTRGNDDGGRGRRGRGRGTWRGQGGEFRPKREFDRHSGSDKSGVKPVDKREGGGAHNWGTYRDEINEQIDVMGHESGGEWSAEKSATETPATPNQTSDPATGETKESENVEESVATEECPAKELTLDEWKALRGNRQKPTFNIRKAGEGEDPTQWKKMYALNNKKEGHQDDDDDEEYELAEYPQRVGRQKHVLDIDIHFSDSRRGGRIRGGRGGGRGAPGGGAPATNTSVTPRTQEARNTEGDTQADTENRIRAPRGGRARPYGNNHTPRPGRGRQSAPKVDDEKDFPSLG